MFVVVRSVKINLFAFRVMNWIEAMGGGVVGSQRALQFVKWIGVLRRRLQKREMAASYLIYLHGSVRPMDDH